METTVMGLGLHLGDSGDSGKRYLVCQPGLNLRLCKGLARDHE